MEWRTLRLLAAGLLIGMGGFAARGESLEGKLNALLGSDRGVQSGPVERAGRGGAVPGQLAPAAA